MKNIIYISIIALVLCACSDLVEGLNDDPNNPTSAAYQNTLTGAEVGTIVLQSGETSRRAGIFAGYYTGIDRQHEGFNSYTVTTSDFDNLWDDAFVNALRNAKVTQSIATDNGVTGVVIGITQVLQAQTLGTVASLYGDIPFDDAAQFEIENPMFEGQTQVYSKIQLLLDEAIGNLQLGTGRPPSNSDIYFDGDPDAWIEVAYTLKARFYMHVKDYANAYTAAGLGVSDINNGMYAPHGTAADNSNLSYQFFAVQVRGADLVTSDFMTSLLAPDITTSPDFTKYRGNAKTNETGRYNFYFNINSVGTQPNTSVNGWAAQDRSAPLVTYEENLLILAEAGFREAGFAVALGHLNDFRSFMNGGGYIVNPNLSEIQYDAYIAADFATGGIENIDGVADDNALLREILEERYVTFFGQIEGFADTRRTETEVIVRVPLQPNTGTILPQRFIYPQSEIDRNANIPNPLPSLFDKTAVNL